MTTIQKLNRATLGTALAAALAASIAAAAPTRALAQPSDMSALLQRKYDIKQAQADSERTRLEAAARLDNAQADEIARGGVHGGSVVQGFTAAPAYGLPAGTVRPANDVALSVGTGRMVRLDGPMSDLFVADDKVADVQVRSADQLYIFGKAAGETTVYATNKAGRIVYSANVKVGTNIDSINSLLHLAMPKAQIQATPMNGLILLTGTVAAPEDVEEASRLVQAYVGEKVNVISRLKTATPLTVMLKVKIAEVSRSLVKSIGVNLLTQDTTGGFQFGVAQGGGIAVPAPGDDSFAPTVLRSPIGTTLQASGKLFGLNILSSLDLAEDDGLVTTLAEPTLTAISGETASFLAGGEFPIPISQSLGAISVEYKEYGVGLAFTPVVLDDGRISMRVRPEVSELSDQGSIKLNGFQVPALTTRRAETTIELGSGQSFMIAGLLNNSHNNSVDKAPWLGDLPIIGALFRSNSFKRNETELVIVVTPYLVKPVNANQIALPTDGFRTATDAQRVLLGQTHDSLSGVQRPVPVAAPPLTVAPGIGPVGDVVAPQPAATAPVQQARRGSAPSTSPSPGFSFK